MKFGKIVAVIRSRARGCASICSPGQTRGSTCPRAQTRALSLSICPALLSACGGKPVDAPRAEPSSGQEREHEGEQDSLSVQGLRGTLSQEEVQNALEPRMPKFARCVQKRSDQVEWLSGHVALEFHVKLDGSVATV